VLRHIPGVFEGKGWTVHTPDLIGHGRGKDGADRKLVGVGLAEYRADFAAVLKALPPQPVLLGHSMGALLAQQLAASGLARALILVSPAPHAGILPSSDSEKNLSQSLMGIPSFWKTVINPDFDLACFYSLNRAAEGSAARGVRQIRARIGARLFRDVLLDARRKARRRGRYRCCALPGALPFRHR
jgi:Lysophospholipase